MLRPPKHPFAAVLLAIGLCTGATAQNHLADLLEEPGANLADPAARAQIVERMRVISEQRRQAARARAGQLGMPLRVDLPNGSVREITAFDGDQPVYFQTHNANAAISTGANLVRSAHGVDGTGITIGMWDGGSGRATHQEFGTRMIVKDGSASIDHATHVGGTVAAAGIVASAKGMAPLAVVDSYDWNSDVSEMTARGATAPNQADKIYLSNHSYGYISGWNRTGGTNPAYVWYGDGTNNAGYEYDFGRYNTYSRDQDALSFNAPYYLIFRSAGNERTDNPANGNIVQLSPSISTTVTYDSTIHPPGDGNYRGGFETIAYDALAKNVMTVGSVTDAVTSGLRDPSKANPSTFSSFGPTDDGRIKPDIVANGDGLYSSLNGSDTSYGTYSGTSMSTPNATGSAALLIQRYGQLFPNQAMRSSTLKGLIIHTADDRGNAGPDYKYGWGLMNAKAAADLVTDHHAYPAKLRITESQLTTSVTSRTQTFVWDGSTPIRATLVWTDPAGTATTTNDLRTPRLVNNLNVKVIAPNGSEFFPYVMPFVGTWTQASMDLPATTGINNTDNVEQVLISTPPMSGTYQVVVSYSGTLTNSAQNYSLLISGSSADEPPPPPLSLSAITPTSGLSGSTVTLDITGTSLGAGTTVKLTKSGQSDIPATGIQLIGESLRCQVNLANAAAGLWNVVATNPDASTSTLANAFTVIGAIWSESFDGTVTGWTSTFNASPNFNSNNWSLSTAAYHTYAKSYFAEGPAARSTAYLTSPSIAIPANATNLQLKFWHNHALQNLRDGGKIQFAVNGGTWFDVVDANSGLAFASNGYNATLKGTGGPSTRNEFDGKPAWTGSSAGFIETIINFTDTAKFTGKSLQVRWVIATDSSTASTGWHVDSVSLLGGGDFTNQAPTITSAATIPGSGTVLENDITYRLVAGSSANLTVSATDDGAGESALTYTWSASGPAAAFVTPNGTNAAKSATISFEAAGDYQIIASVTDPQGLTTTSSLNARVTQVASGIQVSPSFVSLTVGGSQAFSATTQDQFGANMATQPTSYVWSASGGGSINASGLFTSNLAGGPYSVTATSGGLNGNASVMVNPISATVTLGNLNQTYNGQARPAAVTTNPPGLAIAVTYDGSSTAPTNVGTYAVVATVTDPNYQGSASGSLVIAKANAAVTLGNLNQTYDGTPKSVTATSDPTGLNLAITYNGSPTAPTDAGTYAVVATVNETNYQGSASGSFVIAEPSTPELPFTTWAENEFTSEQIGAGDSVPEADADGDGLANLAEYALGSDPNGFTAPPAATLDETSLSLTFTRPKDRTGVSYHAESDTGLDNWQPVPLEVISETETTETLRALIDRPPGETRRFIRLRFVMQ